MFDFWSREYLGAWAAGMMVETAPTSCRVLTLLPDNGRIQLVSTSRHITQGWVDLAALSFDGDVWTGTSRVLKEDPYELRFAFPRGTNFAVKSATAQTAVGALPVRISNHQGWAAVQFTSPQTTQANWQVEFEPADFYHFPAAEPANLWVERVGLDGANLHWNEQYYLNAGYQVYLNGTLLGCSPMNSFTLTGLEPRSTNDVEVRTVAEDGQESPKGASLKFALAGLLPVELRLTELEPTRSNARWRGIEVDEKLSGAPLALGGSRYETGLGAFADSEIEYDLKGLFDSFSVLVGNDSNTGGDNGLEFTILGDGKELWRSGLLRKSDHPKKAEVAITGVRRLVLRVTSPGGRGGHEQGDWAEPKLSRR